MGVARRSGGKSRDRASIEKWNKTKKGKKQWQPKKQNT